MLTERIIRDAKADGKARTIWDSQVRGLGLQITQGGKKNFVLRYKVGERKRQAILARCAELSLAEARQRAGRELAAIRDGNADPLERRRKAREAPTVADLIEQFFDIEAPARIRRGRMRPNTVEVYRYQAGKHILPAIGMRRVEDVTRADIERLVAPLPGVSRNRVLALTGRLFTLAEVWEWRTPGSNPVRKVERAREEARDRVLSGDEMAALAAALSEEGEQRPAAVAAIRVAALTGLRIGEVLAIRWEHVAFETGRLTLPETKSGRRTHDLPTPAVEVLAALPRINDWSFTTGRDAAITYKTTRAVFARAAKAAGLEDVRLHDLRRTVMTNAAMAGVGTHVLRDLLGHKTTAMADRYVRAVGNPVRDAREQVGAAMAAMMEGKDGEVVPMERRNG